ncbi:hypothetical protein GCM10008997_37850 [Halomonas salifodinae]
MGARIPRDIARRAILAATKAAIGTINCCWSRLQPVIDPQAARQWPPALGKTTIPL